MKTCLLCLTAMAFSFLSVYGQTSSQSAGSLSAASAAPAAASASGYTVIERRAHEDVWERVVEEPGPQGQIVRKRKRYIETATGLNYSEDGEWKPSEARIEAFPGGAVARHGQHKLIFARNLNSAGAIDLETPDGQRLRGNVLDARQGWK